MRSVKFFKSKIILSIVFGALACGFIFFGGANDKVYSKNKKLEAIAQMYEQYKQDLFADVLDILVKDLDKFTQNEILFIDIRDKKEQAISMIPGAITQQKFEADIDEYKDRKIIAYCTIGNRSGRYVKHLKQKGIKAYNLIGGILAWAWAEQPLINENGLTKEVHVYGPKWNLLPEGYKGVW